MMRSMFRRTVVVASKFNQPLGGNEMPRYAGITTMMRLPTQSDASGLDACFVGVPLDIGTSHRPGARLGPRAIRAESAMLRPNNLATKDMPFERMQVADIGDVPLNSFNLLKSVDIIENFYTKNVFSHNCIPLTLGGDHTLVLPILRALRKHLGEPVALVHIDAHLDVNDEMFGEKIAHGTPLRRAVEEDLIIPSKMTQIGIRGTGYGEDDVTWSSDQGATVVQAHECWYKSLAPVMDAVRERVGPTTPTYISFDIDGLDPTHAPATGTMEPGGLTPPQALEIVRGCKGLNIVGGDLVEISPPCDINGVTANLGATLLYEMLCLLHPTK
eukprot:TRINITY_DN18678_c0_g1_i1.p1 TRINITY_DN18678_c0_g1~~TRINITY_DN18678_c0_g1_i1.p1  ORF type:complete len:329 (+),score=54.18 TRINITY_DN18678_c0_g1_i1:33-1019(+)